MYRIVLLLSTSNQFCDKVKQVHRLSVTHFWLAFFNIMQADSKTLNKLKLQFSQLGQEEDKNVHLIPDNLTQQLLR